MRYAVFSLRNGKWCYGGDTLEECVAWIERQFDSQSYYVCRTGV